MAKIVVTALITAVVTSLFWIAVMTGGYFLLVARDLPPFEVAAEYPEVVRAGEAFEVSVQVTNPGRLMKVIESIDIYDSFLEGFEVVHVSPPFSSRQRHEGLDFETFYFQATLRPAGVWNTTFRLKAKAPGEFRGDLDVCTPAQDFTTAVMAITVEAP